MLANLLHSLRVGLLGTSGRPQNRLNYAVRAESEHPKESLKELTRAKPPKEWRLESRGVAIEKAYLWSELKGSTSPDRAPDLARGYTKEAKIVPEKQAALAGYRLAEETRRFVR